MWRSTVPLVLLLGWLFFPPIKFVKGDYCYSLDGSTGQCGCCTQYHPGSSPAQKEFCDKILADPNSDPLAWMYAFRGFDRDGGKVKRDLWHSMCNTGNPLLYMMQPSENKLTFKGKLSDYTNRLKFKNNVIAQEGISFCIIGSHYRKSSFSLWEPLKGFLPIAEKSFDIGNHIDPEDPNIMNTFKRPQNPDDLRIMGDPANSYTLKIMAPWTQADVPTHRFEYVWLGVRIVDESASRPHGVPLHTGFEKRPAHPEWQPDPNCENPYVVTANLIEADGIVLHNYLHITVYARPVSQSNGKNCPTGKIKLLMLEVRDQDGFPVGQFTDDVTCDQYKDMADTLSCPAGVECRAHYGSKLNHVPCMFSHPKSVVHPSIFMFSAEKVSTAGNGGLSTGGGSNPGGPQNPGAPGSSAKQDFCRNSQIPQNQRKPTKVHYKDNTDQYVTEVHATWRFAQMDEGWISQLHFATMIIEDETPIQYYTSRLVHWDGASSSASCSHGSCPNCCHRVHWTPPNYRAGRIQLALINSCVNESYSTNRPYGFSAQYHVLRPTFRTAGGWDFFRKQYISPKYVNCHVSISSQGDAYYTQDATNGRLPLRKTLSDFLADKYTLTNTAKYKPPWTDNRGRINHADWRDYDTTYELPDWHNPGMTKSTDGLTRYHAYYAVTATQAIIKMFDSAHQDPAVLTTEFDDKPFREYFGSRYIIPGSYSLSAYQKEVDKLQAKRDSHDQEFTMEEMAMDPKSSCPCQFVPTTPPPEIATKPPVEIEGRRTHVVNMLLAWVILVPLSFFVARFYKETYSRVFFLQEFWWYTMHVLCLLTALLFTFGGIYALKIKRSLRIEDYGGPYQMVWTDATASHFYLGYTAMFLFLLHLLFGAFRLHDVEFRMIQIGIHWLFGWLEYLCAVGCILSAAAIPSGIMNCVTFGIYCGFIVYQVVFTLGMEYHLHQVDNELDLEPPRAYLPPPMMRLFHRDAPHAFFRVIMLAVYVGGCFIFYVALHISMKMEGAEFSCFQPTAEEIAEEISG